MIFEILVLAILAVEAVHLAPRIFATLQNIYERQSGQIAKGLSFLKAKSTGLKVREYLLFSYAVGASCLVLLRVHPAYLLALTLFVCTTLVFLNIVRQIRRRSEPEREGLTEFGFLIYCILLFAVIAGYILSFSLLYVHNLPLSHGYFSKNDIPVLLDSESAILFSGFTFFTMDFQGIEANGRISWIVLSEILVATAFIVVFIALMVNELWHLVDLKPD
jgi:hypothetical protein